MYYKRGGFEKKMFASFAQCHLESQINRNIFCETLMSVCTNRPFPSRSLVENEALESGDPATGVQTKVGSKGRRGGNQFK